MNFETIKTELDNEWNVGVIVKPNMYNMNLRGESLRANEIFIKVFDPQLQPKSANNKVFLRNTMIRIKIIAKDYNDAIKFKNEISRILIEMDVSGGHNSVIGTDEGVYESNRRYITYINCKTIERILYNQMF